MKRWQETWDVSHKGRWTHRLISNLDQWVNRRHGYVNYYLMQMLSGHGCFRAYLHKYKYEDSLKCPTCSESDEDAEHVFFACKRFDVHRHELEEVLNETATPETLVEAMLSSEEVWKATSAYATKVLQELRREEQDRNKKRRVTL